MFWYVFLLLIQDPSESVKSTPLQVGPGDQIRIEVLGDPELSGSYVLDSQGRFTFPLLGEIDATGLTAASLKHLINDGLARDFLVNPMVSVTMEEVKSSAVHLFGDVTRPGRYPLTAPTRLTDLLSEAGAGHHAEAALERVVRITRNEGEPLEISLYNLFIEGEGNIELRHGDVLFVHPPPNIFVLGEVHRPGDLVFRRSLTVNQAIAMVGGRTKTAAARRVLLHQMVDGSLKKKPIKPGYTLKPGDIIEIPLSFF